MYFIECLQLKEGGDPFLSTIVVYWKGLDYGKSHAINGPLYIEDSDIIPGYLFIGCTSLLSISLPKTITRIEEEAFFGCERLSSVIFPECLEAVGSGAFSLTAWENNQPEGLVYAGNVLYGYNGEMPPNTSLIIKEGTTGIADYAFRGCSGLISISLPNGLKTIGKYAFQRCSNLTSISIPSSVISIGIYAFNESI